MKNIAIITGGDSEEYNISIKSAQTVKKHLNPKNFNSIIIYVEKGLFHAEINNKLYPIKKDDFSLFKNGKTINFDAVFMALHGPPAENGLIQCYFNSLKIPYTSCNESVSAITFNKGRCQDRLMRLGFSCADFLIYDCSKIEDIRKMRNIETIYDKIGFPCFVKPTESGSSLGISKVKSEIDLNAAIQKALKYNNEVIIERSIEGTEVSCGVFEDSEIIALPLTEIITKNEFFDYQAKYHGESQEITPANIDRDLTVLIQDTAKSIYKLMNLRGLCRIDFIIFKRTPFVIEINTIPGLSEESIIPKQIKESKFCLTEIFEICIKKSSNK